MVVGAAAGASEEEDDFFGGFFSSAFGESILRVGEATAGAFIESEFGTTTTTKDGKLVVATPTKPAGTAGQMMPAGMIAAIAVLGIGALLFLG